MSWVSMPERQKQSDQFLTLAQRGRKQYRCICNKVNHVDHVEKYFLETLAFYIVSNKIV